MVFSLRQEDGVTIDLPAAEIRDATSVYERAEGEDEWEEIDYAETSHFVSLAESHQTEIVFVLDFTSSMAKSSRSEGKSGIDNMMDAFEAAVAAMSPGHKIGVVEFHDRTTEPSVLSSLTADREAAIASVREFANSGFDPGSSRVWDALAVGSDLFSRGEDVVRTLVFLSDGRDTSSDRNREEAAQYAQERQVKLYALGIGDVYQERALKYAAESTGGAYQPARNPTELQDRLKFVVTDLRVRYKLSYVTLRRAGNHQTAINITLPGAKGRFETPLYDAASFFGPDNVGVVGFDPPTVDRANRQATAIMRARHMPRNIDRIRFRPDTNEPLDVRIVPGRDGGLLDGWTLSGPNAGGWYEASSPTPIEFGNFGPLFELAISEISKTSLPVSVAFDNSIYAAGKKFSLDAIAHIGQSSRLVFYSYRDYNREIYVMNSDGSDQTRLTENHLADRYPSWSPDGQRIVFDSQRDGHYQVYVMNADGSEQKNLSNQLSHNRAPSWSPDGRQIAFESDRDANYEIYVMNSDGSNQTRITDNPATDGYPSWSPDGQRISFLTDRDGTGSYSVYVMNVDGSNQTFVAGDTVDAGIASWSPDGNRLAFASNRDGNLEIYLVDVDGSNLTRLTDNTSADWWPIWSPDGRCIAFVSDRHGNGEQFDDGEIYVMNSDGTNQTRLTHNQESDWGAYWSP